MIDSRPELHLTPDVGWLNDPNGLVQWNGRHHVFHQFDPESFWFGRMQWGHFSSDDLGAWQRHPAALRPGDGPDRDGVWSGCIVDDDGVATAIYTGVVSRPDGSRIQTVCLATSVDPELIEWIPDAENPVAIEPPPVEVEAFRDPYVWRDAEGWWMLLGTGLPDGSGGVFLYRSAELRHWRYVGVFASSADLPSGAPWAGTVWECPNLAVWESGDAVLLVSANDPATRSLHYTVALIGRVEGARFVVDSARRYDSGHDCYAVAVERTDDRVLAYGWSWDALSPEQRAEQGWAGCMTLPRELSVIEGDLVFAPIVAPGSSPSVVASIDSAVTVAPGDPVELTAPRVARIDAIFRLDHTSALRIALRRSPTTGEELTFDFSAPRGTIVIDRSRASELPGVRGGVSTADWTLPADGRLDLTVILDHSIVEIFVGDRLAFTERIYPQAPDAELVRIESRTETFGENPSGFTLERLTISSL